MAPAIWNIAFPAASNFFPSSFLESTPDIAINPANTPTKRFRYAKPFQNSPAFILLSKNKAPTTSPIAAANSSTDIARGCVFLLESLNPFVRFENPPVTVSRVFLTRFILCLILININTISAKGARYILQRIISFAHFPISSKTPSIDSHISLMVDFSLFHDSLADPLIESHEEKSNPEKISLILFQIGSNTAFALSIIGWTYPLTLSIIGCKAETILSQILDISSLILSHERLADSLIVSHEEKSKSPKYSLNLDLIPSNTDFTLSIIGIILFLNSMILFILSESRVVSSGATPVNNVATAS